MSKRKALAGIFWFPDNGATWEDRPRRFCSKSTVQRLFLRRVREGVFTAPDRTHGGAKRRLPAQSVLCWRRVFKAKGGGDGIGLTKNGNGVKIMVLAGTQGLPVAATTAAASRHEGGLIQELFGFMLKEDTPQRIMGDKAYDSDKLDARLKRTGVEMTAPNRSKQARAQDGRPLFGAFADAGKRGGPSRG